MTQLPGRGNIASEDSSETMSDVPRASVASDGTAANPLVRDLYGCGRGLIGLTALIFGGEEAAAISPEAAAGVALAAVKTAEQGCGGLICAAVTSSSADNKTCHDAMDYTDITRQAGYVLGAVATGSETRATDSGLIFAAAGNLREAVDRLANGEFAAAVDSAYSFRDNVNDLVADWTGFYSDRTQDLGGAPGAWDDPPLPGRGDIGGSDKQSVDLDWSSPNDFFDFT